MRTVWNLLENKTPTDNTIPPETMVIDGLKKLIAVNLSYLIVKNGEDYLGIFSERDYTRKLVLEGRSSRETMVKDVMTVDLPRVDFQTTVEDCMYLVNNRGSRYVAVFENDSFVGIITIHDLIRELLANKEQVFDLQLTHSLINTHEHGRVF